MGTVVGLETAAGVVLAGDRRTIRGGTVASNRTERVFDFEGIGAAAIGDEGAVGDFRRHLDAELRAERQERDREIDADVLARIAARVAEDTGVEAIVSTHDDEGAARLRQVGLDGSVLAEPIVAIGSGAPLALGQLEAADRDIDLSSAETLLREILETVADRDPETGGGVDVWSLATRESSL